jgi:hypothetical protein
VIETFKRNVPDNDLIGFGYLESPFNTNGMVATEPLLVSI